MIFIYFYNLFQVPFTSYNVNHDPNEPGLTLNEFQDENQLKNVTSQIEDSDTWYYPLQLSFPREH